MLVFRTWATCDVHGKQPMIIKVVVNKTELASDRNKNMSITR